MERVKVGQVELEYEVHGSGLPLLLIHGALVADALRPLVAEPALAHLQLIHYHRRGYAGSSRPPGATSTEEQTGDAIGLLDHLGVDSGHVVGHSGGALIALTLAATYPTRVQSLALLEPPPTSGPAGTAFLNMMVPLADRYRSGDPVGAVHGFLALIGPAWRVVIDRTVPGGVEQAEKDASTFYDIELASAPQWAFGAEQAAVISCPTLSVLGTASGSLFAESRKLLHAWLPRCVDADIAGATHLLQMEQPHAVAAAIAEFLRTAATRGST